MKNFTRPLIFLIICLIFQTGILSAQSNGCGDFDFTMKTNGVYCGSLRGGIEIDIIGGSGQYTIEWDGYGVWDKTNSFFPFYSINDLPPNEYNIKVMDTKSRCIVEKNITLDANALPEGLELTGNSIGCNGMGTISVRMPTLKPPFNISLKGPITRNYLANNNNFRIHNLPVGTYEVGFIIDGCVSTATTTIDNGEGLPQLSVEAVKGNCGISTGAVKVNIVDGKAGYTLKWEGPTNGKMSLDGSAEIPDFISGSYKFTLEDANGCLSFQKVDIDKSGLSVALTPSQSKCNQNGSIKVDITSGIAPYTISWRGGGTEGSIETEDNSTSLALPRGTYLIEIKDANGCTTFANSTIIEQPSDLYCSITPTNTTCSLDNGTINIFISGGKKPYTLSYTGPVSGSTTINGSTEIENLPAGIYTTFLQDADGCSVSESSEIKVGATENAGSSFTFFIAGTRVSFYNSSTAGSYEWSFGDGSTSTSTSPNKTYSSAGAYEVCLTTTGMCNSNTQCQTIQIAALKDISGQNLQPLEVSPEVGLRNDESNEIGLKVAQNAPNPFVNQTNILFELPVALLTTITIHDNTGRVIQQHTANYEKGSNLFTFNQNSITSGVYYYTVQAGIFTETKKMLVK